MHWVLQNNLFQEAEWDNLVRALERRDIPYSVHKVVPFIGELEPDLYLPDREAICFGSYAMRHVAKRKGWKPGVYDLEPYDHEEQMRHWGRHMLNADAYVLPFSAVRLERPMFVRPTTDCKYFTGAVFQPEEFRDWQHKVVDLHEDYGDSLTGDTSVMVCEPKNVAVEVRFWIVDEKPITASVYKRGGRVIYDSVVDQRFWTLAWALVTPISVDKWNPVRAFVVDICETGDGELKVVEINTINAAGFYAGDVAKIVEALN